MLDSRVLVGEDDKDPPISPSELPADFDQVLEHRLEHDWRPDGDYWPPANQHFLLDPGHSWPGELIIKVADQFPDEEWPTDGDLLYRKLAHRYRGYAQFVFADQFGDSFPEVEVKAKEFLWNFSSLERMGAKYPYSAHIGFTRAKRSIRWEPYVGRNCPLCGDLTWPNQMPGSLISQQGHPPRWCYRCSFGTHRVPTQSQAIESLQYFVSASGFVPYNYVDVFRIPPGIYGSEADKVTAGRMSIPAPPMVNQIGLGPWNNYLSAAGLLEEHVATHRGVQSRALDGHWTKSLLERSIDDHMTRNGIEHTHEPPWPHHPVYNPRKLMRADWKLRDGTLVEAAGMMAVESYANKMANKVAMAKDLGINLVVVTPADINRLDLIFMRWIREASADSFDS